MKLSRSSRFVAALVTIVSLLFTQLAVASHACPAAGTVPMSASMAHGDMAGCQDMGADQPGLCKAHCEAGHQSPDTPAAPVVQPFVAAQLALILPASAVVPALVPSLDAPLLAHTTAPPLAIRNCCFRV